MKRPLHALDASESDEEPQAPESAQAPSQSAVSSHSSGMRLQQSCQSMHTSASGGLNQNKEKKASEGRGAWIRNLREIFAPMFEARGTQTKAFRLQTGCSGTGAPSLCFQVCWHLLLSSAVRERNVLLSFCASLAVVQGQPS